MPIKPMSEFLHEDFKKLLKEPSSIAGREAVKLGLQYYGFGKYGKGGVATHMVVGQRLVPISRKPEDTGDREKHEKIVAHSKGLKNDKELTKMKKEKPDSYKRTVSKSTEKLKKSDAQRKQDDTVYGELDKTDEKFESFLKDKDKEVDDLHKKLAPFYDWRGLLDNEVEILKHYGKEGYKELNDNLLKGEPRKNSAIAKYTKTIDNIMKMTHAPGNFTVYFGLTGKVDTKVSDTYIVPIFQSTTLSMRTALAFANTNTKQIMQVYIKKGQPGFYMDGNHNQNDTEGEREFLLPRNTTIKIIQKDQTISLGQDKNITFYETEIASPSYQHHNGKPEELKRQKS